MCFDGSVPDAEIRHVPDLESFERSGSVLRISNDFEIPRCCSWTALNLPAEAEPPHMVSALSLDPPDQPGALAQSAMCRGRGARVPRWEDRIRNIGLLRIR